MIFQAYLKSKLEDFTGNLQYSKDILENLEKDKKYQSFTDEVNSFNNFKGIITKYF